MIYERKILTALRKQIDTPEIIVLTGMRRVGKTTVYRTIYDEITSTNKVFLDIENPLEQKIFEELDYNNILKNLSHAGLRDNESAYVFLDEIQAMPEIVKSIKYLYDHYRIKFFLTGSSSYYLKNLFPESLAGRKFIFELFPLDFEEFLIFKNQKKKFFPDFEEKERNKNLISYEKHIKLYEEYLEFGGFPGVVIENKKEKKSLRLDDIFKSYYEKDIKSLAGFRDLKAVREVILLLLQRTGSKLDITKLSSEIGVSRETIYSYLSFLESTYFITTIRPYSKNVDREISGTSKVYICDTGIINKFARVHEGQLLENAVFNNLRAYGKIQFYQKRRSEQEIDFVIQEKTAIEVKRKGTTHDVKRLESLVHKLGIKNYYVASKAFISEKRIIPVTEF